MGAAGAAAEQQALPFRIVFGWGLGTLGVAVLFNATNLLLLRFLTDFAGLAAAAAGLAMALSKIYDAITDPLMGVISDRTRTRWGRRRPYLLPIATVNLPIHLRRPPGVG